MSIQPLEGSLGSTPFTPFSGLGDGAGALTPEFAPGSTISGDAISRIVPPWLTGAMSNPTQTAMFGPLPGLMQQLMQMLQYFMGAGMGSPYGSNGGSTACPPYGGGSTGCPPYGGNEEFFRTATGASEGDPHLSFNGNKWNSMVSQPDLLNSDSIPGGFRVSTQVTAPNDKGITKNQSATVSLNGGRTTISMDNCGKATIDSFGQNIPISAGQTLSLGNGTSVTCNQNGSLSVTVRNATGGQIDTTLAAKGQGVDVDMSARNVDLGGALVNGGERLYPGAIPEPPSAAGPGPVANPFAIADPSSADPFRQPIPVDPENP
jgi:hypothetical protein